MALKQDELKFTKFIHVENGKAMVRRIHRIEVQARNSVLYTIRGDDLPDMIQTSTGAGRRGENLAQILVNPKKVRLPYEAPVANPWPKARDLINMGVGFLGFVMVKFTISVLIGDF